jgi:hypothetical protein
MSNTKFTPGPWFAGECSEVDCVFNKSRSTIAQCFNHSSIGRKDSTFNAKLIAAAPDLYEALSALVKVYSSRYYLEEDEKRALLDAKNALGKARGGL